MNKKKIKGILFDLDGVLIDSYQAWYNLLNAAALENGFPEIPTEKYDLLFGQSVEADIQILFPGMKAENLARFFEKHFFDYLDDFHLLEGTRTTLEFAREKGLKVAVVTNTTTPLAAEILKYVRLSPDILVGSGDVENDKPAPDMLLHACELLKLGTHEVIMVGDSDFDARASESACVHFVGFGRAGTDRVENHKELLELLKEGFLW